jgi:uncharacterized protein (TIGR02246 family)
MKRIFLNVVLTGLVLISASFVRADINDDIATIKKMEQDLNTFTDTSIFEKMTTPEWVIQEATGITNKVDFIKSIKAGDVHLTFVLNAIDVRVYGDSAIATYSDNRTGTFKGVDVSGYYMDSDMFVRQNGTWKSVYSTDFKANNEQQDIAAITKLERDWTLAGDKGDAKRLAEIISPDWINVRTTGEIETREENIKRNVKESKSIAAPSTFEISNIRVCADIAIVTGIFSYQILVNGKVIHEKQRFQDVFNKRNGVWLVVNSANTPIKD